jgi:hypothetical protein
LNAPAIGRQPNPKHFFGYTPGGEGGGVNYDAFPDFGRLSLEPNPQCLPLVKGKIGDFTFDTEWRVASSFELELRAQMHRIVRHLEEHPLSEQEYERLHDLAAMAPLSRKPIDDRLERLGLVEEYDPEASESSVECTELFYSRAFTWDGKFNLPYVNAHEKAETLTTVTNLSTGEERTYSLEPEAAVKSAYLQELGDFNWWTYAKRNVEFTYGQLTVACGDWCARLEQGT